MTIAAATSPAVTAHRPARRMPPARLAHAPKALPGRMARVLKAPAARTAPAAPMVVPAAPAAAVARVAVSAASIRAAVAARLPLAEA